MLRTTVIFAAMFMFFPMTSCQLGFSNFNPQRQQSDFAFPQSDFVYPNFFPQQQYNQYQRPNQRPQNTQYTNNNNFANFGQQQQGARPKPTFAPKFTTVRTAPLSFVPPQLQTGTLQANRLDERISQTSKKL